jgi:hypothetical protein
MTDPYAHTELGLTGTWRETREHRRACGHTYEVQAPTSSEISCTASGRCGAFAVGRCGDCEKPVCNYHAEYAHGRLLCNGCIADRNRPSKEEVARAVAEAKNDVERREAYIRRAQSDESEHARLTPGLPYPPLGRRIQGAGSPYPTMTYADRLQWAATYKVYAAAPSLSDIVRVLEALVPDRLMRVRIATTGGFFSRSTYAEGWPLIVARTADWDDRESRISSSNTDLESRLLVTPEATTWALSYYIPRGQASRPMQDFDGARRDPSGTIDWAFAAMVRRHLLTWLGHEAGAVDQLRPKGLECDDIRWGARYYDPHPPLPSVSFERDPHPPLPSVVSARVPDPAPPPSISIEGRPLLWDGDTPVPVHKPLGGE